MAERLSKIQIILDGHGHPCGASVITDWSSDTARVKPVDVDPQEPVEILAARLAREVDTQLALF